MGRCIQLEPINPGTCDEEAAFAIQEQYKKYFFVPEPAFRQAVANGHLIGARLDDELIGYIWSTCKDGKVRVRYLAVHPDYSGIGVGRSLVEELKRKFKDAYSINLSCRVDYPGWKFWKRIGFRAVRNRVGKAKAGSQVTDFTFQLSPLPLFPDLTSEEPRTKIAIDANVYLDLCDEDRPHFFESSGLLADWIEEEFELCVTAALHDDISHREVQDNWPVIKATRDAVNCILDQLSELIGSGTTKQDLADRLHLAHAIAENIPTFITRDQFLLDNGEAIYNQFGMSIFRPVDFVVSADSRTSQFQFDRRDLVSVRLTISNAADAFEKNLLQDFCRTGESVSSLVAKFRGWRANPDQYEILSILDAENFTLALAVIEKAESKQVIHFLRIVARFRQQRKGRTLQRCLLSEIRSRYRSSRFIEILDQTGVAESSTELSELGFSFYGERAFKVLLSGIWNLDDAVNTANEIISHHARGSNLQFEASPLDSEESVKSILELEHRLWPAKINSNGCVPCIAVPIRPNWARALFDPNLGQRHFWDEDADLLLNPVNAYYTGARFKFKQGRLLWYVSESKDVSGTKRIRACSQLTRRVIGSSLELYREFRHFGVYRLSDVEEVSRSNRREAMALEFRDTEVFESGLQLSNIRNVIGNHRESFQWPTKVDEQQFFEIYRRSTM